MTDQREILLATFARDEYRDVPRRIQLDLVDYLVHRRPPSGFLRKALENDLLGAVCSADSECIVALRPIVKWIHNEAIPGDRWGSQDKVAKHLKGGE